MLDDSCTHLRNKYDELDVLNELFIARELKSNNKSGDEKMVNEFTSLSKTITGDEMCEDDIKELVAGDKDVTQLNDEEIINVAKSRPTGIPESDSNTDSNANCDDAIETFMSCFECVRHVELILLTTLKDLPVKKSCYKFLQSQLVIFLSLVSFS